MSDAPKSGNSSRSSEAARSLAEILVANAEALGSNELTSISEAMTAVRARARELEAALSARGWGGDVLYGWGEDHDEDAFEDEDGEDDEGVVDDEGGDNEGREDSEDGEETDEEPIPEDAVRFTVQSRSDFYLVDEKALMKQVLRRASDLGLTLDREYLDDHGGAMGGFAELWGFEELDLTGMGLVRGGSQLSTREIEETLWEMDERDFELRGDAFPTDG